MAITRHGVGQIMSQIVEHGDTVYLQGFTADDKNADIKGQTQQVLARIDAALAAAGTDKSRVLSAQSVFTWLRCSCSKACCTTSLLPRSAH